MGCELSTEAKVNNFLIITANVGSLFENQEVLEEIWLTAFSEAVNKYRPHFIALHCQEIGGKFYAKSKESVQKFMDTLSDCKALKAYTVQRGYVDEDHEHVDQYTALGNFYFIHNKVENLQLYDFIEKKFKPVEGKIFHSVDLTKLPDIRKEKFKQEFFPECKWSRKGYIRTRWKIGKRIIELVNIHLFHDESNLLAMLNSPSSYSGYRKRALQFVIEKLSTGEDSCENGIFFLFGDLNFRLDLKLVLQKLLSKSKRQVLRSGDLEEDQIVKMVFRDHDDVVPPSPQVDPPQVDVSSPTTQVATNGTASNVDDTTTTQDDITLVLCKKVFNIRDTIIQKDHNYNHLREFDQEMNSIEDLHEFDVTFPPTYPYSEDADDADKYMQTRCPAWCDRILLSPQAWELLRSQKCNTDIVYGRIGEEVCMGDHKPVFLSFNVGSE